MQAKAFCARICLYILIYIDVSSGDFCNRQEQSYKTVKTTCQEVTGLSPLIAAYFGFDLSNTCYETRLVTETVVSCCVGWMGDSCNIPMYIYSTPAPNCKNFTTERPHTSGEPPTFVPSIGNIRVALKKTTVKGRTRDYPFYEVTFTCGFENSAQNDYWYRVTWYQNGCEMFVTDYGENETDIALVLTESHFLVHGFTLGNTLSCDVRAYTSRSGPAGAPSSKSPDFFVGIEVIDRVLIFHAGETAVARVRPTIPIACKYEDECDIALKAIIPDEDTHVRCSGLALQGRQCGVSLRSENPLNTTYEIKVSPAENGQYQTEDGYYEIFLETKTGLDNKIWQDYALPKIHVHVQRNTGISIFGKRCHSDNDPHMKTFDGRRYEMQTVNAVYTLYQHEDRAAEIQIRLKRCNNDRALCNCGIAARVGQDVYKMDFCDTDVMFMNYLSCGDNVLKVKSNKEYKYKILLPYGTYAEVDVQFIYGSIFLGIRIQPSTQDINGMSSGLCGSLDDNQGNDFQLRDLSVVSQADVLTFTNSWRVLDESQNMFSYLFDKSGLAPLPYQMCVCRNATEQEIQSGDTTLYPLSCEPNAVATCVQGKDTSSESCSPITRFRRSIRRNPLVPRVKMNPEYVFSKRKKREASGFVWDAESSETFCTEYVMQSPIYSLCSGIPNARPDEAIDNCALDVQITQDTEWANISMESMQSACLAELYRNVSLRQQYDDGSPSIAEQIENIACVNNCSLAGRCENGECLCEDGLGGSDCSMDLNQPPFLQGILDNGLCDEMDMACSAAYIFGHFFADNDNLTCKLSFFELSSNGTRRQLDGILVAAEFDSFIEVKCPIPLERTKRSLPIENSFVYGYTVHVSNDGKHYGEGKEIYIYNSECQSPVWYDEEHAKFVIKNGSCFINGYCLENGYIDMYDNCSVCDPEKNQFGWSDRVDSTGCRRKETHAEELANEQQVPENMNTHPNIIWIIALVLSVTIIVIAIAIIIIIRFKSRGNKVRNSQIFVHPMDLKREDTANMRFDQRNLTLWEHAKNKTTI